MGQDVKYPIPDKASATILPPLINITAAESHYHRRLFDGSYGLPQVEDVAEINAELYQCKTTRRPPLGPFKVPPEYFPQVMEVEKGISPIITVWLGDRSAIVASIEDMKIIPPGATRAMHGRRIWLPIRFSV